MWRILKKLFGFKPKKKPSLKNEEEFENLNEYMNGSADLNINSVIDSKSTLFFKAASDVLDNKEASGNEEKINALQSFISSNDEDHLEEIIVEEEKILVESQNLDFKLETETGISIPTSVYKRGCKVISLA